MNDSEGSVQFFHVRIGGSATSTLETKQPGEFQECEWLVLPTKSQSVVLRWVHKVPMAGHLGISKTKDDSFTKVLTIGHGLLKTLLSIVREITCACSMGKVAMILCH